MGRKKGSGKKLQCLNCFHCKTRVFESVTDLTAWCGRRTIKPNSVWINDVIEFGRIRLMWCEMQTDQFSPHGFSPRNASPKYTANILDILRTERSEVVITNENKDPFIRGMQDICPYMLS